MSAQEATQAAGRPVTPCEAQMFANAIGLALKNGWNPIAHPTHKRIETMTMTIRERETLQSFADKPHASNSLHAVVAVLARVALKEEAARVAQLPPERRAIAKCARCGVDLFGDDDFNTREDNGASACWQAFGHPDKPCFKGRAALRGLKQ